MYDLIEAIQEHNDTHSILSLVELFKPLIKKTLHYTTYDNREDLEQEQILLLIQLAKKYDLKGVPNFYDYKSSLFTD